MTTSSSPPKTAAPYRDQALPNRHLGLEDSGHQARRLRLAVIFGGCSSEYGVSLESAAAVIQSLNTAKYEPILIGISQGGDWYRYYGPVSKMLADTWCNAEDCHEAVISPSRHTHGLLEFTAEGLQLQQIDAALPILHGKNGEDGTVQGLLTLAGIPIVGCGVLSSALCMDKVRAHAVARAAGIPTTRGFATHQDSDYQQILDQTRDLQYPLFVKPVCAGSSFGVSCVKSAGALFPALELAWRYDTRALVEEKVTGVEIGCAILSQGGQLVVGELDEIEIQGDFFDFHEKYSLENAKIHLPARISAAKAAEIKELALRVYRALGCEGFARVDLFLTPEGRVLFHEVNTIPGFTEHSRYPKMLQQAGLSFEALLDLLVEAAV